MKCPNCGNEMTEVKHVGGGEIVATEYVCFDEACRIARFIKRHLDSSVVIVEIDKQTNVDDFEKLVMQLIDVSYDVITSSRQTLDMGTGTQSKELIVTRENDDKSLPGKITKLSLDGDISTQTGNIAIALRNIKHYPSNNPAQAAPSDC